MLKSRKKRAGIARAILEMDSDINVLQEVEASGIQEFCDRDLKGEYRPIFLRGNDPYGKDVVVLVKSKLPLDFVYESHRDEPMSNPLYPDYDRVFSRDLTTLTARVPGYETPLFVLMGGHAKSRHPKARRSRVDPQSCVLREEEARRSAELVEFYRGKFPGTPVLMAADFNADVNTAPEYEALRQTGLKDCFDIAQGERIPIGDPRRATETYFPKMGEAEQAQYDAVLMSPEGQGLVVSSHVRRDGNPPAETWEARQKQDSDHLPVEIRLDLQEMFRRLGIKIDLQWFKRLRSSKKQASVYFLRHSCRGRLSKAQRRFQAFPSLSQALPDRKLVRPMHYKSLPTQRTAWLCTIGPVHSSEIWFWFSFWRPAFSFPSRARQSPT